MNKELKSIPIGNKLYVQVDERVREFHRLYPNGNIVTDHQILGDPGSFVFVTTSTVTPDVSQPDRLFTGVAYENEGSSQINQRSALENCETSSVGRALGFLNIGLIPGSGIASADEVQNAVQGQTPMSGPSKPAEGPKNNGPATDKQINFISKLRSDVITEATRANSIDEAEEQLEKLTKEFKAETGGDVMMNQASVFIEKLLELKKQYEVPF